jgi:hypothetical protein
MMEVFDKSDLKPECLHAVIKTAALLSDMGDIMALTLPEGPAFDLAIKLDQSMAGTSPSQVRTFLASSQSISKMPYT